MEAAHALVRGPDSPALVDLAGLNREERLEFRDLIPVVAAQLGSPIGPMKAVFEGSGMPQLAGERESRDSLSGILAFGGDALFRGMSAINRAVFTGAVRRKRRRPQRPVRRHRHLHQRSEPAPISPPPTSPTRSNLTGAVVKPPVDPEFPKPDPASPPAGTWPADWCLPP